MHLVAISTVEIHTKDSCSTTLQARLGALVETLRTLSGCASYSLTRCSSRHDVWIMTGYWNALATMEAHFSLPCLADLFALTLERLADTLKFGTFVLSAPGHNPCAIQPPASLRPTPLPTWQ
ncbi:antibiotic biosynthesis monooxygenase [Pseudomonas chlororaphis]|nr:antibiotic biosynthesis monooxygenase [Pseudomonas chlororaphis]